MYHNFYVFSKSKAFHGIIFQEKSFTITFCKPCKLFVNLHRKFPMALSRVVCLKTRDTIGNCFKKTSLLTQCISTHKITNLWKFELNIGRRSCHALVTRSCVLSDAWFRDLLNSWKITSFSKTTLLQREPFFFHNVLFVYQPLPITRYQVRFYANNYFE